MRFVATFRRHEGQAMVIFLSTPPLAHIYIRCTKQQYFRGILRPASCFRSTVVRARRPFKRLFTPHDKNASRSAGRYLACLPPKQHGKQSPQ